MIRPSVPLTILAAAIVIHATGPCSSAQTSRHYNERHVIRSVRLIHSSQVTYQVTTGNGNYGSLEQLRAAGFIDAVLASGNKYGFRFSVSTVPFVPGQSSSRFVLTATPRVYRKTGIRSFFIDASGEMRGADKNGQIATVNDPFIDDCTSGSIEENERCTISDLRWLHGAQATYASTVGNGNYGSFSQLYSASLIRTDLADGLARGYAFDVQLGANTPPQAPASFKIRATPQTYGTTAVRSFFIDQTGILRGADKNGEPADENDPPVSQ